MKKIYDFDENKRNLIFENAAREMKLSKTIIEKDYWVCVVLDYLMNESKYKNCFIFKGGTSLSKCYGVINRFSEDVDLVLKWDTIGFTDEDVYKTRSKNQDYIFETSMNSKGAEFVQNQLKKDLLENLVSRIKYLEILYNPEDPMTLYVKYSGSNENGYISSSVKLEIGPVASKTPTENKTIRPYCCDYFDPCDEDYFDVETVSIARSFWEKLLILYAECQRPFDKRMPSRYSRHYYYVYMIYKSKYFPSIISDKNLFYEVKKFKSKYYRTSWSKIEMCSLDTICIVPSKERKAELESDYRKMGEMIFGNKPSLEEIVSGLKDLESELRNI